MNSWPNPVSVHSNRLNSRISASSPSQTVQSDRATAYDRWAVDIDEPTIVSIRRQSTTSNKRSLARHNSIMPVTSGSQSLLASLPTFMSVFGDGTRDGNASITTSPTHSHSPGSSISHNPTRPLFPVARKASFVPPRSPNFYRRDSSNTIQSESTESSPTTTISTVDSTLTESSPSSSPDSPTSLLPMSSLSSSKVATPSSDDDNMFRAGFPSSPSPNRPGFSRSDSPNKKPRNTKNLSVNTLGANRPSTGSSLPRLASTSFDKSSNPRGQAFSAPASPSFVIPVMAPKRKPSNLGLSISTSEGNATVSQSRNGSDIVPQTPSFPRLTSLRHMEGLGAAPLFSPIGAPEGGMRLPPLGGFANGNGYANLQKTRPALSLSHHASFDSNHSSPIVLQTLDHVPEEADHDLPLSREVKSPAYPQGPVCIYPPSVYLYLEPNDVEASEFDVVINVAREVLNPFEKQAEEAVEPRTRDVGVQVNLISTPMDIVPAETVVGELPSAVSEKSFRSAFEVIPSESMECPDTPKPLKDRPEYIHVPWEHNTKVSLELLALCELIDDRVQRGKRVLIHCQCGVSRSASLIIAYGLYKNPQLSDIEAYNMVKERSRWINPNMHLIFELHAFYKMLAEKNRNDPVHQRSGLNTRLVRTQTDSALHPNTYPISPITSKEDEPASAPLQDGFQPLPQRTSSLEPTPSHFMDTSSSADEVPGPFPGAPEMAWSPTETSAGPWREPVDSEMLMFSPPPLRTALPQKRDLEVANSELMSPVGQPVSKHEPVAESSSHQPATHFSELKLASPSVIPPLRQKASMPAGFSSLMSRRQISRQLPLRTEFPAPQAMQIPMDSVMVDAAPESPSLLSPRAAEFTATPFHRTAAGDLAGTSFYEQSLLSPRTVERDPRSPAIKGEAPITRSIDDVL